MKNRLRTWIGWGVLALLFLMAMLIRYACDWYNLRFGVSFEEILFTITSPLAGSDVSFLDEAVQYVVQELLGLTGVLAAVILTVVVLRKIVIQFYVKIGKLRLKFQLYTLQKWMCIICTILLLISSVSYVMESLQLREYIASKRDVTTIYEEHYVNPNEVAITAEGETKNLIYIYVESMETTYASKEMGGSNDINYIPKLTALAQENLSFSNTDKLGGARLTAGSTWTMGALFSITSGIPFSLPIEGNSMSTFENFAPGLVTLGDILDEKGYNQTFLCGSDGTFGGRENYFTQHGNYDVVDYYDAIDKGYIDEDYYVWWGYEDLKLYDIAKKELLKLTEKDKPFNFTMLTADAHHVDGYVCENCGSDYPNQLGNVIQCTDNQVAEFVNWCKEQEFYEDTVIIITGDHFRMDSSLIPENADRRLYNCFINNETLPQGAIENRDYTSLDLFPTTLAAMGFKIEGEQLGLGVNLFSNKQTLTEKIGFETLDSELAKYSEFYEQAFYY